MKYIRPYELTGWTEEHLVALAQVFNKGHNVDYAFFNAFSNLMNNMELGKPLILTCPFSNFIRNL